MNMRIFVERCYRRNHWYVVAGGRFIAGPYAQKGDAVAYIIKNRGRKP